MPRAKLLRSTPIRFALTYGLLFVFTSLAVWVVSYELLKRRLHDALDGSVQETYSVLEAAYAPDDIEDLVATMNSFVRLNANGSRVFLLTDRAGKALSGNLVHTMDGNGLTTVSAAALGLPGDERFRVLSGTIDGYRLIVGHSFAETDDLARMILVSFGWACALAVLLAFGTGAYLARRAQQRLDAIADTMSAVSQGQLQVRIPLSRSRDDIDEIAGHINQALSRLSALIESMRQVSTDIAHDLKTPLNRLKLMVEDALSHDATDGELRLLLEEALSESDQINATFDALLRISQIEAGGRKLRFYPLDLGQLVRNVIETYSDVAEDNQQSLIVGRIDDVQAQGDKELFTQMLVNLIENAITHCPQGTKIAVDLVHGEQCWILSVADDGPGIPEDERTNVFRRLYRLDKSRSTPGSGLGLSLVQAIADFHGAAITIEDNNPGTRIVLRSHRARTGAQVSGT
ncbi:HAMP domain-containing histidine kinase [Ensifer adhaerens]|uniref:sensor histidine kinase n=1 Tax=Ensifer adhaerens TaxID=106592 RepID=UPI001CCAFE14|nr:HAMP domain-containing sensor histidine kinase [Ensifer adhaerens]MBZ7926238.1 HAMP domain-containing histidine kinase [Ensifer adhaerens]UAX97399.1 HAMP domain-containing histidine kinase [Ensifer adhaerens]UAY03482.1 HAMP domain-containing histidine kinase [Ensifer adhaerens]UAY11466.1 HAMP domain-containing histidine kinase [Ensifer adhaerens]